METSSYHVKFNYSDGVSQELDVAAGETLLDAALAADIPLLYQCRSGSCSCCMAQLTAGEAVTRSGASSTLLSSEYDAGKRLLCLCQAESDCSFELDYSSSVGATSASEVNAFIDSIENIGGNVIRLTLELAEGDWLEFLPGQFVQIEVPGKGVLRSYSPYSTSVQLPKLELMIRLQPDGVMSEFLQQQAEVDQVLKLSGPYGAFFLREETRKAPHIFIAGGTGLAPILSMIDSLKQRSGSKPPMLLNFGCSRAEDLFGLEDIELRQHWLPTLEARICVSHDTPEGMFAGNPVAALRAEDVRPDSVAYLCGPQGMIDAATTRLLELGMKPEQIFAEQFVASN